MDIALKVLLGICTAGFIWRLARRSRPPSIGNPPDQDITNLELYHLLSKETRMGFGEVRSELRWIIGFQTGILATLLALILSQL